MAGCQGTDGLDFQNSCRDTSMLWFKIENFPEVIFYTENARMFKSRFQVIPKYVVAYVQDIFVNDP